MPCRVTSKYNRGYAYSPFWILSNREKDVPSLIAIQVGESAKLLIGVMTQVVWQNKTICFGWIVGFLHCWKAESARDPFNPGAIFGPVEICFHKRYASFPSALSILSLPD